jgi:rhodanese-related sulfurtransferase
MKKQLVPVLGFILLILTGCGEYSLYPVNPPETVRRQFTPMTLASGHVVVAGEAEAYLNKRAAYFLDVRHALAFRDGRIPGAASMPFTGPVGYSDDFKPNRRSLALSRLRIDKSTPVIIYGADSKDWRGYYAAGMMIERGYDNVMWLRGGYEEWVRKGIGVER